MTPQPRWMTPRQINSPGDLADVIKVVSDAVRAGELNQITPGGAPFATHEDIRRIVPGGPWPDYLELHFQDVRTGKRFTLVAETFHGAGGRWEPVP